MAVLGFESNAEAREAAPAVAALVASRLSEVSSLRVVSAADLEALRAQAGQVRVGSCAGAECGDGPEKLGSARFVVTGRLDRFGERYVLTASAVDAKGTVPTPRPRVEVTHASELPSAARLVADLLARALGLPAPSINPLLRLDAMPPAPGTFSLGLRVGSALVRPAGTLTPGGEVEIGVRFHPEWVGFLQVGLQWGATQEGVPQSAGLHVVPGIAGARHLYDVTPFLQPYWGLGLGIQLAFGPFGFIRETGPLPALHVLGGVQLRLMPALLVVVEGRTNMAQTVLGITGGGTDGGFNLELSVGFTLQFG